MSDTSLVMKGLLSEFNLAEVLQVVSMSRQYTAVELRHLDGRRHGVIWIKSGQVIAAQRGAVKGIKAFYELFRSMAEMFVVWRLQDPPSFSPPIGRIPELLIQAADRTRLPEGSQAGPRPLPDSDDGPFGALPEATVAGPPPNVPPLAPPPVVAPPIVSGSSQSSRPLAVVSPRNESTPAQEAAPSGIVVAVCSPKGGVGKTTIALNLSVSLAQRGMKMLLVDADINGDQLGLLDARDRVKLGVYDILDRPEALDEALRDTAAPNLRLLPASGPELSPSMLERASQAEGWRNVLDRARTRADIALVDCPAGMFGVTHDVLGAATHVIGVFQSEMVAQRSFAMFMRGLSAVPAERRPKLLGVVVNMFHRRSGPSVEAFHGICDEADQYRLFETTIPRSEAFAEASLAGQPLRLADGENLSPVAWLFDMLADEVCSRFDLGASEAKTSPRSFLV